MQKPTRARRVPGRCGVWSTTFAGIGSVRRGASRGPSLTSGRSRPKVVQVRVRAGCLERGQSSADPVEPTQRDRDTQPLGGIAEVRVKDPDTWPSVEAVELPREGATRPNVESPHDEVRVDVSKRHRLASALARTS